MTSNKRMITMILAAVLALSLLLTACGNGGDTPTGDNSTPGVTDDTPTGDNSTPSTSSDPTGTDSTDGDNTPSADNSDMPLYLGHNSMKETEKYLKFSSNMFPEHTDLFETYSEGIFPEVYYED